MDGPVFSQIAASNRVVDGFESRIFNNIPASKTGSLKNHGLDSKSHSGFAKMGFVDDKGHSRFVGNFFISFFPGAADFRGDR